MAYNPTSAPAHIEDFDGLRKWIEEELRNLAQNYADDTKLLDEGTGSVATDLAALEARVTDTEADIATNTANIATNAADIVTLDARVDQADDYIIETGSSTALTSNTDTNLVSKSITAGTWDLYGYIQFSSSGGASSTDRFGKISTTTAETAIALITSHFERRPSALDWSDVIKIGPVRVTLGGATTYYLNAKSIHSGGSGVSATGVLEARRVIV